MRRHLALLSTLCIASLANARNFVQRIPVNKDNVEHFILNTAQKPMQGLASYYDKREQGKETASGERYNANGYTCASRYYKLGTWLKVTFPTKHTFVYVRVNDRGPWIKGRILDLSEHAAKVLGLKPYGVAYIEVQPAF